MPYSKNYPNALGVWVSDVTKQELETVAKMSGLTRVRIIRKGIKLIFELYKLDANKWREFLIDGDEKCQPPIS